VFLRTKENVPPAFKQYKIQGNASNLVQSHFGSPPLRRLESGIAPLVPRSFDPAYWGMNHLTPSHQLVPSVVSYGNREQEQGTHGPGRRVRPPEAKIPQKKTLRCHSALESVFPGILDKNFRGFIDFKNAFSLLRPKTKFDKFTSWESNI